jgi:hypothetical protein
LEKTNIIHFEESKSGELTCSFQGKYLHSKYNPLTEGERFAETIQADFSPLCVFIIEPALSYCAKFIKKRFPNAEICAIRFCHDFCKYDNLWNRVFYLDGNNIPLSEQFFNVLGEEKLCSSLSFDWNPTKQAFSAQNLVAWKEIKSAILKARDVIGTRAYFSKRWLKNSVIFASKVKNTFIPQKGDFNVLIAASGPSLESSLPFIKQYQENFFLIALSSAFMPLCKNGIVPDMVISTDGGYWAKKHLDFPGKAKTIFAIAAEGAVQKSILTEQKILSLCYEDGLENALLDSIGCSYIRAERNGTVAGTALCFAHSLSTGRIYLCGFDQAPSPSFQHTQPNALETDNAKKDFRLRPGETRISFSRFNSTASLKIYREWFITNSEYFSTRVFRLSNNFKYDYALGKIHEINWDDFRKFEQDKKAKKIIFAEEKIKIPTNERKKILFEKLKTLSESQKFRDEVFTMDSILIRRELSAEKRQELETKLTEKIIKLLQECEKLL